VDDALMKIKTNLHCKRRPWTRRRWKIRYDKTCSGHSM